MGEKMCVGGSAAYLASQCEARSSGMGPFSGTHGTLGQRPLPPTWPSQVLGGHVGTSRASPGRVVELWVGAVSQAGPSAALSLRVAPDGLAGPGALRALFSVAHSTLIHKVGNTTPCSAV